MGRELGGLACIGHLARRRFTSDAGSGNRNPRFADAPAIRVWMHRKCEICGLGKPKITLFPAAPLPTDHEVTSSDHWLASAIRPPARHLPRRGEHAGRPPGFEYRSR